MKTYLVDSDVLIDFFKKKEEAVKLIENLIDLGEVVISAISIAELRTGWNKQEASLYLPRLYNIFTIIPISRDIAEKAGEIREKYSKKGNKLPTIDALIAATSIVERCCLISRNIKHYPKTEVDFYQYIYK